jgi:hypothetical protein
MPPVARTTAGALNSTNFPDSRQYANAPAMRSPSVRRRTTVHSMNTSMSAATALC